MATKKQYLCYSIIGLLALIALFIAISATVAVLKKPKLDPTKFHGTWLQSPRSLETFSLDSTEGKAFTNKDLQGHWTLMYLGFTNCGYSCPTTMAELSKTYRLLESKHITPLPKVVMVSIDSDRDTVEKIAQYVQAFHHHFQGARGKPEVVEQMAKEMGLAFTRVPAPVRMNAYNYDIQHSGAIIVFNPKGELNAFFTTPHKAEQLAANYRLMVG